MSEKQKRKPKVSNVVPLQPSWVDTPGCAALRNLSTSYVIQERQDDSARISLGYEPHGPRWHRVGSQILYKVSDVDAWLKIHAEPFGKTARGRKPIAEQRGAESAP